MGKSYRWLWIRDIRNTTNEFNKKDFLQGKVFWFIDEVTGEVYNVRKDATNELGISFSNNLLLKSQQNGSMSEFSDWLKNTSCDLWNLYTACRGDSLISYPSEFFLLKDDELTIEIANFTSKKYDLNLLNNYLKADSIDKYLLKNGCTIDGLEADFEFMASVINLSYDKKMFVFCSDRLKSSYEMVWFMVNRFSDDRSFVTKIVDSYLKVNSDLEDRIAILRLMSNMGFDNYRSLLNSYSCGH